MKTIDTTIKVDEQRTATTQLPDGVKPGTYRAIILVFDGPEVTTTRPAMADFPRHDVQVNLPDDFTFRREQIYDDSGRGA